MADYQIDLSQARIRDLKTLRRIIAGEADDAEFEELASRIVIGGIDEIPLSEYGALVRAVFKAFRDSGNPKAPTA